MWWHGPNSTVIGYVSSPTRSVPRAFAVFMTAMAAILSERVASHDGLNRDDVLRQGVSHILSKVRTDELFRQIADRGIAVQKTQEHVFLHPAGHQDDGEGGLLGGHRLDDLLPVHARHREVGDE